MNEIVQSLVNTTTGKDGSPSYETEWGECEICHMNLAQVEYRCAILEATVVGRRQPGDTAKLESYEWEGSGVCVRQLCYSCCEEELRLGVEGVDVALDGGTGLPQLDDVEEDDWKRRRSEILDYDEAERIALSGEDMFD